MIADRLVDMVTSEDPEQQAQAVELAYSLSKEAGNAARQVARCLRISEEVWQLRRDLGHRYRRSLRDANAMNSPFHLTERRTIALRAQLDDGADWWLSRGSFAVQVLLLEVNQ